AFDAPNRYGTPHAGMERPRPDGTSARNEHGCCGIFAGRESVPYSLPCAPYFAVVLRGKSAMASNCSAGNSLEKLAGALAMSLLSLTPFPCSDAVAAPETGWWWNPAESGRGYFVESQGGITYMAVYLYADDGRARWLVAGGPNDDPYHYAGRL